MLPFVPLMATIVAPVEAPQEPLRLKPYPQLIATRYTTKEGLPPGGATGLAVSGKQALATTAQGVYTLDGKRWTPRSGPGLAVNTWGMETASLPAGAAVLSAAMTRGGGWVVTAQGAFRREKDRWIPVEIPRRFAYGQPLPDVDLEIRQVTADGAGHVWLATASGAYVTDGADWWQPLNRADGMPYEDLLCLTVAPNGDLWGGTPQGAWRLRDGQWRYFWGRRWLPGNRVNAIAVDEGGAVWLATDGGVTKIEERRMTLAEKAARYEAITQARHDRSGWITSCGLKVPGDPEGGILPEASDNDGLWTALYVCAESYRYAMTKDPKARALARKSMNAMLDLVRLSGYPGFPARAIIRKGENVSGYNPEETVRIPGETEKIWYPSPVDPNLLVKGDTSSDELDGHYLAWYVFSELAADESDRKAVAEVARAVTDNLLAHDYTLVGHTGRKTRWGVFGPQYLNEDPGWFDERGLNSAELLCYLKVTHHLTGDRKYADAYDDLIAKHHYLINTLSYRRGTPWYAINHSDDELAYCVYYPLLMLEKDPHRRALLTQMIASTWNGGPVTAGLKEENSPFYSFIYGAATGMPCRVEEAVETLRDWPWELINWEMRNSHRHDVTLRTARGYRNRLEVDRVLPVSERRVMRWNGDPWEPDEGGDGSSEEEGAAWLLPYWMGRYHGLIAE